MHIVVGSGPSGIACASALLEGGRAVTMIDAGLGLEPERKAAKAWLAARDPSLWEDDDLAFLRGSPSPPGTVPDKLSHGSDFPYRPIAGATPLERTGTGLKPSHAVAGLSTVWGSAVLPYRDADMRGWPIGVGDLADSYAAVAKLMPLSAEVDDLAPLFPLHQSPGPTLPLSRQADTLMKTLARHRAALQRSGLVFGRARLAVEAGPCVSCGLCLQGCPHDLIASTKPALDRLRAAGMAYRPGLLVRSIAESDESIAVNARDANGAPCVIEGARVFLGAGALNTAEIMLRSRGQWDHAITIKDSQYFLMPALLTRGTDRVEAERLNTLCQIFIELIDPRLGPFTIHLQAYTYSAILRDAVMTRLGRAGRVLPMGAILGRLALLQGYLHSDHSGTIEARLTRGAGGERLVLTGRRNPESAPRIAAVARKLTGLAHRTGLIPIRRLVDITEPGRGFHAGGGFPMARDPGPDGTDLVGRPTGFSRLHIVDSSIFPTIPATTITLSVMANADGIARAVLAGRV